MTVRKRRKSSRYPGTKTHGRGRKNRTRGLGNRGGRGMSGTGKRGDQKKTLIIHLYGNTYFGKEQRGHGLREKKKIPSMSLASLREQIHGLIKQGRAKEHKGAYDVDLHEYKIIGNDGLGIAMHIRARAATPAATRAIEQAGGSLILPTEKKKVG